MMPDIDLILLFLNFGILHHRSGNPDESERDTSPLPSLLIMIAMRALSICAVLITTADAVKSSNSSGPAQALDVTDFGALGDGSDDTAAFQKALDEAAAGGSGVVLVPAGTFAIRGHLVVPPNTELRGVNNFPYRSYGTTGTTNVGTTLEAYEGAGSGG